MCAERRSRRRQPPAGFAQRREPTATREKEVGCGGGGPAFRVSPEPLQEERRGGERRRTLISFMILNTVQTSLWNST
jgi:hypothetical protein